MLPPKPFAGRCPGGREGLQARSSLHAVMLLAHSPSYSLSIVMLVFIMNGEFDLTGYLLAVHFG
eukprot:12633677-Alexandrium_andersonii.AAC.1